MSRDDSLFLAVWNRFHASIHASRRGAVPFCDCPIFNELVPFVGDHEIDKYLCAAGIPGHYVGDCGQRFTFRDWAFANATRMLTSFAVLTLPQLEDQNILG